jgi:hypothetical protein
VSTVQREDAHTEERIAQILNEAQQAMQIKKAMGKHFSFYRNMDLFDI